jgi:D-alanyl-D-alanine carboxypeptidase
MSAATSLPECVKTEMVRSGTWRESSPVPLSRLSLISVPYVDFDGNTHEDGQLVTLDVVAEHAIAAFNDLFILGFPIEKILPIHLYDGDDDRSMADNNSSCYCCRAILQSPVLSVHAYGAAIDVNPLQNPYIVFDEEAAQASFHPKASWKFANRYNPQKGMVESIVDVFAVHGFYVWGGRWTTPIDYHHFQIPRGLAELLVAIAPDHGKVIFDSLVSKQQRFSTVPMGDQLKPLLELYRKDSKEFFQTWSGMVSGT